MFKLILWATDGSQYADRALELAKALASQFGASLLVFHGVEFLTGPGARGAFPEAPDEDERQAKIAQQVRELGDHCTSRRAPCSRCRPRGTEHRAATRGHRWSLR